MGRGCRLAPIASNNVVEYPLTSGGKDYSRD